MNLYGIEKRNTIGKAIMVADCKATADYMYNHNLKYVTYAKHRGERNVLQGGKLTGKTESEVIA